MATIKSRPTPVTSSGRQTGARAKVHFAAALRYKPTGLVLVVSSKQTTRERIYEEFARARKLTCPSTAIRDELRQEDLMKVNFVTDILPRFEVLEEMKMVDSASKLSARAMLITKYDAKNPAKGYNGR